MRGVQFLAALMVLTAAGALAESASSQSAPRSVTIEPLPFGVGEELVYRANLGRFGGGRGSMRVEAVDTIRGRPTYRLRSDLRGRVAGMRAEDRTLSWLDPDVMTSLRFSKRERNPFSSFTEDAEIFPERLQWVTSADSGETITDAPLDELSFIYFVRTLPLVDGDEYVFERHYDAARNPTRVRVIGRESITVPAGEFRTVVVEMRVRDGRRYDGEGTVRLHLTDDRRRIPVRVASRVRLAGRMVLTLESAVMPDEGAPGLFAPAGPAPAVAALDDIPRAGVAP
jgi:hypothetical protein